MRQQWGEWAERSSLQSCPHFLTVCSQLTNMGHSVRNFRLRSPRAEKDLEWNRITISAWKCSRVPMSIIHNGLVLSQHETISRLRSNFQHFICNISAASTVCSLKATTSEIQYETSSETITAACFRHAHDRAGGHRAECHSAYH